MNRSRLRPQSRSQTIDRQAAGRAATGRLVRTILLGTVAVGAAIFWLGDQWGIDSEETLRYLGAAALFVGGLVVLGLFGFLLLTLVKRITKKD